MKTNCNIVQNNIKRNLESTISDSEKKSISSKILINLIALIFLVSGYIYQFIFPNQVSIRSIILLIGAIIVFIPILISGIKDFIKNIFTMEQLVLIAIFASLLDGKYEVAIIIPLILSIVHFLEERSILGGKDAIDSLKKYQVNIALLEYDDGVKEINVDEIKIGNIVIVKPGMIIPIDGIIISGSSSIDNKSLTGEAIPRDVNKGEKVFAGTININGLLKIRVVKKT